VMYLGDVERVNFTHIRKFCKYILAEKNRCRLDRTQAEN
jgi:hypothetical protein